jgi:4-methylaminobutanoate oxidase (formaldehyde-forming)
MRATRERVALYDLSTYAKFIVQGPEAVAGLQHLCTSNVDVDIGRVVYTLLCNERGGIEMDPTVTRLDDDRYLVIAPTLYQRRTEMLLRNGLPPYRVASRAATRRCTSPYGQPAVSQLTMRTSRTMLRRARVDSVAKATALRVSFTGELGWALVLTEFAADVYAKVAAAGAAHGMRHAGAFAFDGLRLERLPVVGHDISARRPYAWPPAVRSDKDFVGKRAHRRKDAPRKPSVADDRPRRRGTASWSASARSGSAV